MPPRTRKLFPTPDDAEAAFYDAFERGDLAAMMVVWAEGEDVVCVHPSGPRLTGLSRTDQNRRSRTPCTLSRTFRVSRAESVPHCASPRTGQGPRG